MYRIYYYTPYCHTRLHLGFPAKLKIEQVPTYKMEPQRGWIMKRTPSTQPSTHPPPRPNLLYSSLSGGCLQNVWVMLCLNVSGRGLSFFLEYFLLSKIILTLPWPASENNVKGQRGVQFFSFSYENQEFNDHLNKSVGL